MDCKVILICSKTTGGGSNSLKYAKLLITFLSHPKSSSRKFKAIAGCLYEQAVSTLLKRLLIQDYMLLV